MSQDREKKIRFLKSREMSKSGDNIDNPKSEISEAIPEYILSLLRDE